MNEIDIPRDRWIQRLMQHRDGATTPTGEGRVLRLKLGYNPNSSSVGSVVSTLLWSATIGSVALNIASALIRQKIDGAPPTIVGQPEDDNA